MKVIKAKGVRYLVLISLGSANLFLFQNCSNYSGQVSTSVPKGFRANKEMQTIIDNSPSLIDAVNHESRNEQQPEEPSDNAPVVVQVIDPVNHSETTQVVVASTSSTESEESEAIEHSQSSAQDPIVTPSTSSPQTSSPEVIADNSQPLEQEPIITPSTSSPQTSSPEVIADNSQSSAQDPIVTPSTSSPQTSSPENVPLQLAVDNSGTASACDKYSKAAKLVGMKRVDLDEKSDSKDIKVSSGNVLIVNKSKHKIKLRSLSVAGNVVVCGKIHIEKMHSSQGNLTLIEAHSDQTEMSGTLRTSKINDEGIEMEVESHSEHSDKK